MRNSLPVLALGFLMSCKSCGDTEKTDATNAGLDAGDATVMMDGGKALATEILEDNGGVTPELDTAAYQEAIEAAIQVYQDNPAKQ